MPFLTLAWTAGKVIFLFITIVWILSLIIKNASIIDIVWGIGFIIIAWLAYLLTPQGFLPRKQLITTLVTIWGMRLALHIGIRNWGKPEDFRYAKWREENGSRWWWLSFFQVFLLQGCLMWVITLPILATQTSGFPAILTPLDWVGTILFAFGLLFESVGDLQLMRFKATASNRNRILTTGLWKYTRHPNYFGEAVVWWGIYVIALAAGAWWTIFSPVLMTWLLVRVSGVAMLERTMKQKRGYEDYVRTTSAFFPWFPAS